MRFTGWPWSPANLMIDERISTIGICRFYEPSGSIEPCKMNNSMFKTGEFQPLSDDVLAKFNAEQRAAYDRLASAVAELNAANWKPRTPSPPIVRRSADLREAEAAEAKKPKTSFLNEWRAAKEQYAKDHP